MQIHWWEFQISEWRCCMAQGRLLSYCFYSILLTPFHGNLCIGVHHQLWLLSFLTGKYPVRLSLAQLTSLEASPMADGYIPSSQ